MKTISFVLLGISAAFAQEIPATSSPDREPAVVDETIAMRKAFEAWQHGGNDEKPSLVETFLSHAKLADEYTESKALMRRILAGDRLRETQIQPSSEVIERKVTVRDLTAWRQPESRDWKEINPVWRRITPDRLEIWTPRQGKLFDASGQKIATAEVKRHDGIGREWYGAFLSNGEWITTDLFEMDRTLTFFSKENKWRREVAGKDLVQAKQDDDLYSDIPLIAWARADRSGKAWIVSVGADFGLGVVRMTPEGKSTPVPCPWTETLPQQLGPRGMYVQKSVFSDDGSCKIERGEAGHGSGVGWPSYAFSDTWSVVVPDGGYFGILPGNKTVYVELPEEETAADTAPSMTAFFSRDGKFQRWIKGSHAGVNLDTGELLIARSDDTVVHLGQDLTARKIHRYHHPERGNLVPVEIHEDIGLGLFRSGDQLILGSWERKEE